MANPPELEAVLQVQSLDDRASELRKEIAALPKQLAEIEKKLEGHIRKLDSEKAALAASQKKRKSLEDDIKTWEQKTSKIKDQLTLAKTNEQYRAFQNEIEYAQKEIRNIEDQILVEMENSEPLEKNMKTAEGELAAEKKVVAAEQERVRARTAEDEKALASTVAERAALTGSIDTRVLGLYEKARKRWHTSGVADATSGRCDACHITLRPQFFQELKTGDRIMTCESCGRILFYNPPVSLEHELHQKA